MSTHFDWKELAAQIKAGEPAARQELVLLVQPAIRISVRRALGPGTPPDELEEVIMRAHLALIEALPKYEGTGSLDGYARSIARRQAIAFIQEKVRRRQREVPDSGEAGGLIDCAPDNHDDPLTALSNRELAARFTELLWARLAPRLQLCMQFHFVDDRSPAETALLMNTSVGNVHVMLFRIRAVASKILRELQDVPPPDDRAPEDT